MSTGPRFGDRGHGAVVETKLGEVAAGLKLASARANGPKLGDAGPAVVPAPVPGNGAFFNMHGPKLGDVANESVRFGAEWPDTIRVDMSGVVSGQNPST